MLGTVEGFAFGKVGFAFYLTDRAPTAVQSLIWNGCVFRNQRSEKQAFGRPTKKHLEVSIAMGAPPNGWFIMENPIKITKMDDLGVLPF